MMNIVQYIAWFSLLTCIYTNDVFLRPSTFKVPNIVHQIYDYQSPNFFLFLSLLSVQHFLKPERHILWVNDEGKYRKGHWDSWQRHASDPQVWENRLLNLITENKIEIQFLTFPSSPPGNESIYVSNKAHRSDFVRYSALQRYGGIYLDTDAFVIQGALEQLRIHEFTLSFDNIVNPDPTAPKRLNNGVIMSAPNALFLQLWLKKYAQFHVESFEFDSSVVPYQLAMQYPDLIHIEMNRISPISYAFQTSQLAEALTCGLYVPPETDYLSFLSAEDVLRSAERDDDFNLRKKEHHELLRSLLLNHTIAHIHAKDGAIWYPRFSHSQRRFTFEGTVPDFYLLEQLAQKYVLHLTMSQVRGICMMRKTLGGPADLEKMPSLLGRIFRIVYHGKDDFDYSKLYRASAEEKFTVWKACRDQMGMHSVPDIDDHSRQQYVLL